MDSEYTDNPAGRLWLFLKHVAERGARVNQNSGITFRDVFTEYFGEDTDDIAYYARISSVLQLPVDIRQQISALPNKVLPEEILLRPLPTVQQFLSSHADGRHAVYRNVNTITDGVLNDLQTCSHILAIARLAPHPTEEQRASIREAVDALIAAIVADKTLSPDLARVLLRYAHRILLALDDYAISGPEAIADANHALIGFAQTNVATLRPHVDVWDKFTRASTIATLALTLFTGPAQIGQSIDGYTDMLTGTPVSIEAPGPIVYEQIIEATLDDDTPNTE